MPKEPHDLAPSPFSPAEEARIQIFESHTNPDMIQQGLLGVEAMLNEVVRQPMPPRPEYKRAAAVTLALSGAAYAITRNETIATATIFIVGGRSAMTASFREHARLSRKNKCYRLSRARITLETRQKELEA